MAVEELDPVLAWKAIEGYTNELDGEARKLEAFYRQFPECPRCNGAFRKEFQTGPNGGHAFADKETLLPRALLRCATCNFLLDPHSGVVVELGRVGVHLPSELK